MSENLQGLEKHKSPVTKSLNYVLIYNYAIRQEFISNFSQKKTPLEPSLRKPVKFLLRARAEGEETRVDSERRREMVLGSARWASIRIITGTILGGILGFYVMNRLEVRHKASPNSPSLSPLLMSLSFFFFRLILGFGFFFFFLVLIQEKMQERLLKYEMEKRKREANLEFQDSSPSPLSDS